MSWVYNICIGDERSRKLNKFMVLILANSITMSKVFAVLKTIIDTNRINWNTIKSVKWVRKAGQSQTKQEN